MTTINMLGRPCPIPVIETKKALREAGPGAMVSVLVDNDIARQNLEKMAAGLGFDFQYETTAEGNILAAITVRAAERPGAEPDGGDCRRFGNRIQKRKPVYKSCNAQRERPN